MIQDSPIRSAAKALTWRLSGSFFTGLIVFWGTGRFDLAVAISGVEIISKMVLYYVHERIWDKFSFGRKKVNTDTMDQPKHNDNESEQQDVA